MSHQSGSRPLTSDIPSSLDPYQNSSGISLGRLSLGDPVGIFPEDQSLHQPQQVLDGIDFRAGQTKALFGPGTSLLRQGDRASSPKTMPSGSVLPLTPVV